MPDAPLLRGTSSGDQVLGIDVATSKLALAWIDAEGHTSHVVLRAPDHLDANRRLAWHHHHLAQMRRFLLERVVAVVVEVPWAPSRNDFHLLGTAAVVIAALCVPGGPPVLELTAGQWKVRCGLAGNAGKAEVLAFARDVLGYEFADQDVADALAIAHAGWTLHGLEAA